MLIIKQRWFVSIRKFTCVWCQWITYAKSVCTIFFNKFVPSSERTWKIWLVSGLFVLKSGDPFGLRILSFAESLVVRFNWAKICFLIDWTDLVDCGVSSWRDFGIETDRLIFTRWGDAFISNIFFHFEEDALFSIEFTITHRWAKSRWDRIWRCNIDKFYGNDRGFSTQLVFFLLDIDE